jgi:hypothetical protein
MLLTNSSRKSVFKDMQISERSNKKQTVHEHGSIVLNQCQSGSISFVEE